MITYRKRLNLVPGYAMQKVCVSQYDSDIRLEFELYTSEGTFTVESGTTVVIQGTKPDGNGISIDGTLTATQDTDTGTTVYVASFDFDVQMAAVSGKSIYELALYHGSKVLNTANFILFVEKAALDADTIQSDSVLRNLDAIIEGAETATQAAEEAEDAADRAEAAAQTLEIDDTLTQAGQAADAKKVGDEINDLKDELTHIDFSDATKAFPDVPILSFKNQTCNSLGEISFATNRLLSEGYIKIAKGDSFEVQQGYKVRCILYEQDGTFLQNSDFLNIFDVIDDYDGLYAKLHIRTDNNENITPDQASSILKTRCNFLGTNTNENIDFVNMSYSTVSETFVQNSTNRLLNLAYIPVTAGDTVKINSNDFQYRLICFDSPYTFYDGGGWNMRLYSFYHATDWANGNTDLVVDEEHSGKLALINIKRQDDGAISSDDIEGLLETHIKAMGGAYAYASSAYNMTVLNEEYEDRFVNTIMPGLNDMIWTWWFYPQAVRFTRVRDKIYFGYTDSIGYSGIAEYDMNSKTGSKNFLRFGKQVDDHNTTALIVMPDGHIVVGYAGGHNLDNYMHVRVSIRSESIEEFSEDIVLECAGTVTYCQMFLYNGTLFMFYRCQYSSPEKCAWMVRKSTDGGHTWTDEVELFSSSGTLYYCKFAETNTSGMIRMCMLSHNSGTDMNVRMGFYSCSDGKMYDSNGTTYLGTSGLSKDAFNIIMPVQSGYCYRLFDVAITNANTYKLLFSQFTSGSYTDSVYKVNDNGTVVTIANGGEAFYHSSNYQGGCSWVGDNKIVVARYDGTNDIIELYTYSNGSLSLSKTIYSEAKGTLPIRNSRPIVDKTNRDILWHRGRYNPDSFTDFNTDPKIYDISTEEILI